MGFSELQPIDMRLMAEDGVQGLRQAFKAQLDLVLLDVMLPDMRGWDVLTRLRDISDVPIITLTAKAENADIVKGLKLGADDYIVKPFHTDELIARIEALLRRTQLPVASRKTPAYADDYLTVDLVRCRVSVMGQVVNLTPTEFRLLACLVRQAGQVVPHRRILTEVWGPEYADEVQYLKLYVRYLRQKIEREPSDAKYILTEWRVGYYFREPE